MNIKDLKPASALAQQFGVKTLIYGAPGCGKTPMSATAPRPVMCVVEPGMLSMRGVDHIPAYDAYTPQRINEFFTWLFASKEASNFDTVVIDSISQLCEIILTEELARNKDGRKAYGELSRRIMDLTTGLYYLKDKHVWLIAKQSTSDENGIAKKKPYFPGQDLNVKLPHLYDEILHLGLYNIPGQPKAEIAIRTRESYDVMARDRSGKLAEFEKPNITELINKIVKNN